MTISENGAVVDALEIDGHVVVDADDVTIRRTLIRGATSMYVIRVMPGRSGLVVEDTEIDGQSRGRAVVCCSNFTLRRVEIHNTPEGPRINGNVTIEDSYIHHLTRNAEGHQDALQATAGSRVIVRNNRIEAFNPDTGDLMNAAYQFGTTQGPISNVLFEGNLLNGGNYTVNGGGGGTSDAAVTFRGNHFGCVFRFGPIGNIGPNVVFDQSNVWADTLEPVRGSQRPECRRG